MWNLTLKRLLEEYPFASDFFVVLPDFAADKYCDYTVRQYFAAFSEDQLQDMGIGCLQLEERFVDFMAMMEQLQTPISVMQSITLIGGQNKHGKAENIRLTIHAGEIITIVGPTGSGKSRLLADIEWVAQRDTPTGRQILLNGQIPESKYRFAIEHKLVAQLSQNMNFIMDLSVHEFISMHAESRMVANIPDVTRDIIGKANQLAGEVFSPNTAITALSGGQSRALMIADTAYLSSAPIVLIDEIENAGIDRQKALQLLVDKQKIILMATHDPILALMGDKRLVIKNGGIADVIVTSGAERSHLKVLMEMDEKMASIRHLIRSGGRIETLPS